MKRGKIEVTQNHKPFFQAIRLRSDIISGYYGVSYNTCTHWDKNKKSDIFYRTSTGCKSSLLNSVNSLISHTVFRYDNYPKKETSQLFFV